MDGETFFTAVGCMDGRVQSAVAKFGQEKFGARFPDTITEAGIVGLLSKENVGQSLLDSLKFKIVDVSIGMHHSAGIIVHGHAECAGNLVSDKQHREDTKEAAKAIRLLIDNNIDVIPVFVKRVLSGWETEEL